LKKGVHFINVVNALNSISEKIKLEIK